MGENNRHYRLKVMDKFHKELCELTMSSLSKSLTKSGFFKVTDLSLMLIPVLGSMSSLLLMIEKQLERLDRENQDELWECFLRGLYAENSDLAFEIALECDRKANQKKHEAVKSKGESPSSKLVIGAPTDFRHIISATGVPTAEVKLEDATNDDFWKHPLTRNAVTTQVFDLDL